ncbi:MAG: hypothetical protein ACT4O6_03105 [Reyranella sp.]
MATTIYPTVLVAQPEAELWSPNGIGDNDPVSIQADEMFARQLDTGFAGEIRNLVHDPETGLAGKDPEEALGGVAEAMPMLGELKDRYLARAIGPRQRSILEPLIDSRLDRAAGDVGARRPHRGGTYRQPAAGRGAGVARPGASARAGPHGGG